MPTRIPITAAERLIKSFKLLQIVIVAWDGKLTHVTTAGSTIEHCSQAAEGGNFVKDALGWPKTLHDHPPRVRVLQCEVAALKKKNRELEDELNAMRARIGQEG